MRRKKLADGYLDEFDSLSREQARIEPWLTRAAVPPMTYLLIPSILAAADRLLSRLANYRGPRQLESRTLYLRLWTLRQRFEPQSANASKTRH